MQRTLRFPSLAAILVLIAAPALFAQEDKAAVKQAAMAEMLKLAGPGPEHEEFKRYAGTWQITVKMGSGTAAASAEGTAEVRLAVGGRFLQIDYAAPGKMGSGDGQFTIGFDRRHGQYALIAMDSFGTYFVTSQGTRDAGSRKIKLKGTDDDPMMKSMGYTKEFAHVIDFRTADEFVIEVWFVDTRTPERKELKAMDYIFQRKK